MRARIFYSFLFYFFAYTFQSILIISGYTMRFRHKGAAAVQDK